MLEASIAAAVAVITGAGAITNRLHNRYLQSSGRSSADILDKRLDAIELRVAQKYVTKEDINAMVDRVEAHTIRIENKLDKISLERR